MYNMQQWSCDVCTFKQSANAVRCAMCNNPNPFLIGTQQSRKSHQSNHSALYYQRAPPKPKPVVKKELEYQSKPRKDGEYGKIKYQTDRISKQQVLDTYAIYLLNKDMKTSSWPLYVFGDNDIDKARIQGTERDMIGGLAGVLGDYDSTVSFGITSTFYRDTSVNKDFGKFKEIMDRDFAVLTEYVENGHDIIVPSPNMQDLYGQYEHNYWETVNNDKIQVIHHNIGTGLARIPFQYIKYIQTKFDALKALADSNGKSDDAAVNEEEKKDAADIDDQNGGDEDNGNEEKGVNNEVVDMDIEQEYVVVTKEESTDTDASKKDEKQSKPDDGGNNQAEDCNKPTDDVSAAVVQDKVD